MVNFFIKRKKECFKFVLYCEIVIFVSLLILRSSFVTPKYLEIGSNSEILSWGSCLKDCPVEDYIPACETPPPVPDFPLFGRKIIATNF